jgi:hypothetical protein
MSTDKEFADSIHMEIHAIRRLPKYSPSVMEINIAKLVVEHFSSSCKECKLKAEANKNAPPEKTGILNRIGKIISEGEA